MKVQNHDAYLQFTSYKNIACDCHIIIVSWKKPHNTIHVLLENLLQYDTFLVNLCKSSMYYF